MDATFSIVEVLSIPVFFVFYKLTVCSQASKVLSQATKQAISSTAQFVIASYMQAFGRKYLLVQ